MNEILQFDIFTNIISAPVILSPKDSLIFCGMSLQDFISDGFKLVCRIKNSSSVKKWTYENIDRSIMFKDHRSWLYLIVVDDVVFKIGETANPLGIVTSASLTQPMTGSKSRLGRYTTGDATDQDIRNSAEPYLKAGCIIEFWAKECEIVKSDAIICGKINQVEGSTQKSQEMAYLNYFIKTSGSLPLWNKSKK